MTSSVLQPTQENILKTFLNDTISRNKDIFYFINILNTIDDSFSIFLDGTWGSGKTFFVKQVKMVMDACNSFIELKTNEKEIIKNKIDSNIVKGLRNQVCVYYDAWANDNDEDPILSLVYSILQSVETDFSFSKEPKGSDLATAFLEIVEAFTHTHFSKIINALKDNGITAQVDILSGIKNKKDIQSTIKTFLNSLLLEKGDRLVVFIDELDRCRPDFAVRTLERIKHYFANDKITFVFSVNSNELQHTIKRFYGENFDGYKYLDRFFDLRISLPQIDLCQYSERFIYSSMPDVLNEIVKVVIREYRFELREISKYISHIKIAQKNTHNSPWSSYQNGIYFGVNCIVPVMIGLMMYNADMYKDFVDGNDNSQLIRILSKVDSSFFDILLKTDEKFSDVGLETNEKYLLVSLKEKISNVYDAIFGNHVGHFSDIGICRFEKGVKEKLIGIVNLMSPHVNIHQNDE